MTSNVFNHPANIPSEFALAVWAVVHNEATAEHWSIIAKQPLGQALEWIQIIFEANETQWTEAENRWWTLELVTGRN